MKKRLLFAAMAIVCAMVTYAQDRYEYTATQQVKITGENMVTNGDFAEGTDGWTNAAGEEINAEVWSFGEGLGPNGENVLTSLSGSTADAALCQKWDLNAGTYIVMYDIKGDATTSTYLTPGSTNNLDFFLTSTENPVYTRVDRNDGTISVATPDGYNENWKTNAYYFEVGNGQSLVMHFEKLTANTQITNIQLYPAEEVYDDRVLKNKLDFADQLIATGKFAKDTENGFVDNIVETVRGMLEIPGALDDKSAIEGMMASYEEEFVLWLNANGADMLKDEKRWSTYGDTRKMNGIGGNWQGTGGRWFHINNGGSSIITDDGDEIGHRLQGGMAAAAASQYYPVTPKTAGTYMFSLDIVGHYMAGTGKSECPITNVGPNYTYDSNRDFKGVTMFAGKDIMGGDADANAGMNNEQEGQKIDCGIISNPNPKNNAKRFVVFYEVTQDDVNDGTPIYFGITYIPDPERQGGNLGSNVNIANPQIICIGETQDEADYKNEVAAIITQQGPLKERLDLAKEEMLLTAADDRPWGHTALQEAIDTYQPVYDESLTIIDEQGNVLNETYIRALLEEKKADESAQLYSDILLSAVQAMNSARNAFKNANNAIANYRTAIASAEAVLNDLLNASGNMGALQNVISLSKVKLNEVLATTTEETREADEATLAEQLEVLAAAVETFKASVKLEPFIDIDFSSTFEQGEDGYVINGNMGQMVFPGDIANATDNSGNPNEKGVGEFSYALGIGKELIDVLRVGLGEAYVPVDTEAYSDKEILRFNFDMWFLRLTACNVVIDLRNADDQRIAGFKLDKYSNIVEYNDFNNEANEGLDLVTYVVANTTGDAGSHTDSNKTSFSLMIDYQNKTALGNAVSPVGTCTGKAIPLATTTGDGTEITDTKVAKFVIATVAGSGMGKYVGRRSWFDNLKAYHYPAKARVVGDVGGDGVVDVADISAIISTMAGSDQFTTEAADVNGDGIVDVADISAVITIMAGGK